MARKPTRAKGQETKGPKPASPKATEPQPTFIVNGVPVTGTDFRPATATELRLPFWLSGNRLPRDVAEPAEQVFLSEELPEPYASLSAMVQLAIGASCDGILTVRREHAANSDSMDPEVFVQNVIFMLRSARDSVLKQTPAAHVPVFNARLEALIAATKAAFNAFMAEPVDRIWCDSPTCDNRGRHLLPGPWIEAFNRIAEASEDAFRLSSFLDGESTQTVSVTSDELDRRLQAALERRLGGAALGDYKRDKSVAVVHGAAHELVARLNKLVQAANKPSVTNERGGWRLLRHEYAAAAYPALDLKHRMTAAIRLKSQSLYTPTAPPISITGCSPECSVLEVVERLAERLLNALYRDRSPTVEPKSGQAWDTFLATLGQQPADLVAEQIAADWNAQSNEEAGEALANLRLDGLDLKTLSIALTRESNAVVGEIRPSASGFAGAGNSEATKPADPDVANYRDASWIRKATQDGLTGDALSKMRGRGTLKLTRYEGARPLYNVPEVAKARPQYSDALMDALSEGADFRTRRKAERKRTTRPDKARQSPTKPDTSARRG